MGNITIGEGAGLVSWLTQRLGTQIGDGECYTTIDECLKAANFKSARDFGRITPTADYVWGAAIPAASARPGDVLQFHNYRVTVTTETDVTRPDGGGYTEEESQEYSRPHHSAMVQGPGENGATLVLESNVSGSRNVQSNALFLTQPSVRTTRQRSPDGTVTVTTVTVEVAGRVRFYRVQKP